MSTWRQVCRGFPKHLLNRHIHLDIMQDNASASLVLEGQEFLSVLPLLVAVLLEEMGKAIEGYVIPGEVESLEKETQLLREGIYNYEATTGGKQLVLQSRLWSGTDE